MELDEYRRYVQELAVKPLTALLSLIRLSIIPRSSLSDYSSEAGQQVDLLSGKSQLLGSTGRYRVIDGAQGFLGSSANNRLSHHT